MTFQVAESYFRDHLNEQESDYTHANGLYTRTIPESELTLQFGQNSQGRDGKIGRFFIYELLSRDPRTVNHCDRTVRTESLPLILNFSHQARPYPKYERWRI